VCRKLGALLGKCRTTVPKCETGLACDGTTCRESSGEGQLCNADRTCDSANLKCQNNYCLPTSIGQACGVGHMCYNDTRSSASSDYTRSSQCNAIVMGSLRCHADTSGVFRCRCEGGYGQPCYDGSSCNSQTGVATLHCQSTGLCNPN
jgi:hypothetical protein